MKKMSHNFPKKLFQKFLGEAHERAKALKHKCIEEQAEKS